MSWSAPKSTTQRNANNRLIEQINLDALRADPNAIEISSKQFVCQRCKALGYQQSWNFGRMKTLKCEGGEGGGCGTLYYLVQ
jgi:hypothetical protein